MTPSERSQARGTFALLGSANVCELLARSGLGFVIVDCEHSPTSPTGSELVELVRAVEAGGSEPWVRVLSNDSGQIGKALDAGARAIVVPHVRSASDAVTAVRAARRPPGGIRGAAPVVRAAGWGTLRWEEFADSSMGCEVWALIEDPEAVERIDSIAATDGLAGLMFGGFDLAVTLGHRDPRAQDAELERMRETVYAAAHEAGIHVADYAWSSELAQSYFQMGAHRVAIATDISLLLAAVLPIVTE